MNTHRPKVRTSVTKPSNLVLSYQRTSRDPPDRYATHTVFRRARRMCIRPTLECVTTRSEKEKATKKLCSTSDVEMIAINKKRMRTTAYFRNVDKPFSDTRSQIRAGLSLHHPCLVARWFTYKEILYKEKFTYKEFACLFFSARRQLWFSKKQEGILKGKQEKQWELNRIKWNSFQYSQISI